MSSCDPCISPYIAVSCGGLIFKCFQEDEYVLEGIILFSVWLPLPGTLMSTMCTRQLQCFGNFINLVANLMKECAQNCCGSVLSTKRWSMLRR